jgi:hypothetical protein
MDNHSVEAGDPFAFAGRRRQQGLEPIEPVVRRTYPELLAAMHQEQVKLGRHMTNSELDAFARRFYAEEYRQDMKRLMAMGVQEPEEDEEQRYGTNILGLETLLQSDADGRPLLLESLLLVCR